MHHEFDEECAICPRCRHRLQVENEDYDESPRVEECEGCGYKYRTWQTFSVTTHTEPDCALNDVAHAWIEGSHPSGRYWRCSTCERLVVRDPEQKQ